jgi:hypothetical protein
LRSEVWGSIGEAVAAAAPGPSGGRFSTGQAPKSPILLSILYLARKKNEVYGFFSQAAAAHGVIPVGPDHCRGGQPQQGAPGSFMYAFFENISIFFLTFNKRRSNAIPSISYFLSFARSFAVLNTCSLRYL